MGIIIALVVISILPLWVMISNDNYDEERCKEEEHIKKLEEIKNKRRSI